MLPRVNEVIIGEIPILTEDKVRVLISSFKN